MTVKIKRQREHFATLCPGALALTGWVWSCGCGGLVERSLAVKAAGISPMLMLYFPQESFPSSKVSFVKWMSYEWAYQAPWSLRTSESFTEPEGLHCTSRYQCTGYKHFWFSVVYDTPTPRLFSQSDHLLTIAYTWQNLVWLTYYSCAFPFQIWKLDH